MKRVFVIAGLTWKASFRYRLFWILAALLAAAVIGMPMALKDDGTAKGLTQILLTYTLGAVASLLGLATLWLSCGTLARDIEDCQMQVVAVKPISRWQVWLGKWLGLLGLNALLLALSGAAIYFLLQARSARLPADEQKVLRDEIFVARASIKDRPPDLSRQIDRVFEAQVKRLHPEDSQLPELRRQVTEQITALLTDVEPGLWRRWIVDMHTLPDRARDLPIVLRVKFHTTNPNSSATFDTIWVIGPTNSPTPAKIVQTLPPDSFQEFTVPAHLLDEYGHLNIEMFNGNDTSLMFPFEDGLEVLYYENTFAVNFVRGLLIILCWLGLLSAIGLAAASQLSFPVAAFASLAILFMGLSSGTLQSVVDQGTIMGFDSSKGAYGHSPVDFFIVPVFHGALKLIQLVESFSPIDFLSTGRSITWGMLGTAVTQIVLLLGGIFAVAGIILFTRRELATAQSNS